MRKHLRIFLFLLLCASPALAQRTIVSGTVTDPNGIPWAGGTVQASLTLPVGASGATLNGVQIGGSTQRTTLDPNGAFLMQLPDNNVVQPPGTQWTFAVSISPGILPPAGTGPQSFSVTLTITGASQDVSAALSAAAPKLSNAISGNTSFTNITSGVNNSATMTLGTGASISASGSGVVQATNVTNGVGAPVNPCTNGALYTDNASGFTYACKALVWSQLGSQSTNNVFYASNFGVTNAGNHVCDATANLGSTTVTTTANDPAFTAGINGWVVWATASCLDSPAYTTQVPVGTITFVSAHTATVSIAATATNIGGLHLIWGPQEDTQLTNAENAAFNYMSPGTQGVCFGLVLGNGFTVVKIGHFNTINCNNQGTGPSSKGAVITGQGQGTTLIAMTPDFDFTTCPSFHGFNTCFGGTQGIRKRDWGITGFQNPANSNPAAATCILQDAEDSSTEDFYLIGFAPGRSNVIAFCQVASTGGGFTNNLVIDGMGFEGWEVQGTYGMFSGFIGQVGGQNLIHTAGGFHLTTIHVTYGSVLTATNGAVQATGVAGSTWVSTDDVIEDRPLSGGSEFTCGVGTVCNIEGTQQQATGGTNYSIFNTTNFGAGHFYISKVNVQSGSTGAIFNSNVAGALFDDMGGNTFTCTVNQCTNLSGGAIARVLQPGSTWSNPPATGSMNCASSASPAVCSAWFDGSVVIAAGATTVVVNTSTVGANSVIIVTRDDSLGAKLGVTCNTQSSLVLGTPRVSARVAGTSFTIAVDVAPTTNPLCIHFSNRGTQ